MIIDKNVDLGWIWIKIFRIILPKMPEVMSGFPVDGKENDKKCV